MPYPAALIKQIMLTSTLFKNSAILYSNKLIFLQHYRNMGGVSIPSEYGHVLLVSVVIALQCSLIGYLVAGLKRVRLFTKAFMEKNFAEEHKKAFGKSPPLAGNPDMGSGRYSDKLSYKDWFEFNNAQRVHYNYVEQFGPTLLFLLVAGIGSPIFAAVYGWIYFVGRMLYTFSYTILGPNTRHPAVVVMNVDVLGMFITSVMSALQVIRS